MKYEILATTAELVDFCRDLETADSVAFDTEFVSEDSYRPDLCLIQIATPKLLAVIDTLAIEDLGPFWRVLSEGRQETIVHSGREEFLFCQLATGRRLARMFDTQLASAFIGSEYPAAYSSLVNRLLGENLRKGETRTNWRQRPLSRMQLEYALQDVVHLIPMRDCLREKLERQNRLSWFHDEMHSWQEDLEEAERSERWRRVSGIAGLSPRALAVVRELWSWRDEEARRRNCPPRRVLRDDLIVELAKRQSSDLRQIHAVRGLERGDLQKRLPLIAAAIHRGLELADHACPQPPPRGGGRTSDLLAQFLAVALSSICRRMRLAPSLVGTLQDLKDLVVYRTQRSACGGDAPMLARGWRAEVVGRLVDDLLAGKLVIRVGDLRDENPLVIEPRASQPEIALSGDAHGEVPT